MQKSTSHLSIDKIFEAIKLTLMIKKNTATQIAITNENSVAELRETAYSCLTTAMQLTEPDTKTDSKRYTAQMT